MQDQKFSLHTVSQGPAAAYVRSSLAQDWRPMSPMLLKEFESAGGTIQTLLRENPYHPPEEHFEWGAMSSPKASREWIVSLSREFFIKSPEHLLVAQEPMAQRGDPIREWETPLIHFFKNDIFYVCNQGSSSEQLETMFRFATAQPWSFAVLTSLAADERHLLKAEEISEETLWKLCQNTSILIVGGVYDDEGYLVWDRYGDDTSHQDEALRETSKQ